MSQRATLSLNMSIYDIFLNAIAADIDANEGTLGLMQLWIIITLYFNQMQNHSTTNHISSYLYGSISLLKQENNAAHHRPALLLVG